MTANVSFYLIAILALHVKGFPYRKGISWGNCAHCRSPRQKIYINIYNNLVEELDYLVQDVLLQIFNRNTFKLSYSCMNNVKSIISSHNETVMSKSTNSDKDKKNCNCRKPDICPMDGNCNLESIIYQAEVASQTTKETYIGLCDTSFKLRYRNRTSSFRHERYRNATEFGKHVWNLKDQNIQLSVFT